MLMKSPEIKTLHRSWSGTRTEPSPLASSTSASVVWTAAIVPSFSEEQIMTTSCSSKTHYFSRGSQMRGCEDVHCAGTRRTDEMACLY